MDMNLNDIFVFLRNYLFQCWYVCSFVFLFSVGTPVFLSSSLSLVKMADVVLLSEALQSVVVFQCK